MPSQSEDRWAPLRLPAYRRFLAALVCTTLGIQVQGSVLAFQTYALTRDPLALGLLGLAEAIPFVLLALAGGHAADRHSRRRMVALGTLGHLLCVAAVIAVTLSAGRLPLPAMRIALLAAVAAGGVARAFLQPARNALGADVVPDELQARSVTLRTGIFQVCLVGGPALAGVLYGAVGAVGGYLVAGALLALGAGLFLAVPEPPRHVTADRPASFRDGLAGSVRFLRGESVLLPAILLDLLAVLFGGATALLPVFAAEVLHTGPRGFGLLRAAPALGAIGMSVVLALRPPLEHAGRALLVAVAIFGASMIGFALSRTLLIAVALLAIGGAADLVSMTVRGTLMQTRVPRAMRGRMASINQIFIGSSNEIGAFESGVAARLLGTVASVVFGGTVTLLVVAGVAWRAPALRRLRRL